MRIITTILLGLSLTACAHVKSESTEMGQDRYLVSCKGNGYAGTTDTLQCVAKEAKKICDAEGKDFEIIQGNSGEDVRQLPSFVRGQTNIGVFPHTAAIIQCEETRIPASISK